MGRGTSFRKCVVPSPCPCRAEGSKGWWAGTRERIRKVCREDRESRTSACLVVRKSTAICFLDIQVTSTSFTSHSLSQLQLQSVPYCDTCSLHHRTPRLVSRIGTPCWSVHRQLKGAHSAPARPPAGILRPRPQESPVRGWQIGLDSV